MQPDPNGETFLPLLMACLISYFQFPMWCAMCFVATSLVVQRAAQNLTDQSTDVEAGMLWLMYSSHSATIYSHWGVARPTVTRAFTAGYSGTGQLFSPPAVTSGMTCCTA